MSALSTQSRWTELCGRQGIRERVSDKWYIIIKDRYSEEQRKYHTLNHLEDMFPLFDLYKIHFCHPDEVLLAIFFHDIIYDPAAKNNEEKSIEVFEDFSKETSLKKEVSNNVIEMIRATITHMTQYDNEDADFNFFLDFDMAILGSDWPEYMSYAQKIRQEYRHIPDDIFNSKRKQVLEGFLETPHIYKTQAFQETLEDKARENIQKEIEQLSKEGTCK